MVTLRVRDILAGGDTADQGLRLLDCLHSALDSGDIVVVSFTGITTATSSFVNASFVQLLNKYNFSEIKWRIQIVDSNRQINDMIRSRLEREALQPA